MTSIKATAVRVQALGLSVRGPWTVIDSRLMAHDPASKESMDYLHGAGINVDYLPYVKVIEATAVKVQPLGKESHWNVDGELMPHNEVAAHVCQGAVQVFSRGIEVEHSVCA